MVLDAAGVVAGAVAEERAFSRKCHVDDHVEIARRKDRRQRKRHLVKRKMRDGCSRVRRSGRLERRDFADAQSVGKTGEGSGDGLLAEPVANERRALTDDDAQRIVDLQRIVEAPASEEIENARRRSGYGCLSDHEHGVRGPRV